MTSTPLIPDYPDWKSLQGTTLDGGYELKEMIEADREKATFRVRVLGDYSLRASASFYLGSGTLAEDQVSIWHTVRQLQDKTCVSAPLGAGKLSVNGVSIIYLVSQIPDETLADILNQRALEPEEATEMMRSLTVGLENLHSNGLVHGSVSPSEVLAIGDAIRISAECVRRPNSEPLFDVRPAKYLAPESGTRNLTIASDVWCLGATLFEALTQKTYDPAVREAAAQLAHPFGAQANCCLDPDPDQRCKLADLAQIARSKPPLPTKPKLNSAPAAASQPAAILTTAIAPPAEQNTPTDRPKAPVVLTPVPRAVPPQAHREPMPAKVSASAVLPSKEQLPRVPPAVTPVRRSEPSIDAGEQRSLFSGKRGLIYALAGFVVIFLTLWFVRSKPKQENPVTSSGPEAPSGQARSSNQAAVGTAAPGTSWPTKTLPPEGKTPNSSAGSAAVAAKSSHSETGTGQPKAIWRVVLYTYFHQQDADRKAQAINEKRPDLHAEVFLVTPGAGPYLVVAGGRTTREEAARVRLRAIREGMPRDSYIQNYTR